jgi:hypothetical protein
VASGVLDVPQRDAGVEGEGYEGVAQTVRTELVSAVQPGCPGQTPDHAEGGRLALLHLP